MELRRHASEYERVRVLYDVGGIIQSSERVNELGETLYAFDYFVTQVNIRRTIP